MFKKVVAFSLSLSIATAPSVAGELRSELQSLRDTHPLIRASQFAAEASDLRRQAAMAGFLPKVTISGDKGDEKISTAAESTDNINDPTNTTDLNRNKLVYTLEQNIFNGGKTFAEVGIAAADRTLKQSEAHANGQDVLLEALIAYLQVLRNQLLIRLSEINEQTTRQQLEMEKMRVDRGGGVVVDELQAATRLQIVRERRVFYEQGMRDAIATYEQVYGRPPQQEKVQDLDNYLGLIPLDIETALQQGKNHNPRLQQVRLQIERAQQSIALERSGLMPKVDFVLSKTRDKEVAGVFQKNEDSALFKFSWNIFSGGDSVNRTRAAALDRNEAMERQISTQRKIDESIRMSWNQYQKGIERLKLLEEASETSRKVMDGRKRLRDAGRETVLAVLDAEVEHFGVLANKVNAMIDARLGSYRLLHATGLLDISALNLDSPEFRLPVRPVDDTLEQLLGWKIPKPDTQKPTVLAQDQVLPNAVVNPVKDVTETKVAVSPTEQVKQALDEAKILAPESNTSALPDAAQASVDALAKPAQVEEAHPSHESSSNPERKGSDSVAELVPLEMAAPIEMASAPELLTTEGTFEARVDVLTRSSNVASETPTVEEQLVQVTPESKVNELVVQEKLAQVSAEADPLVVLSNHVQDWAEAWSSKDFESYAGFYSDSFETRKFGSKEEWLEHRRPRILGKNEIQIDIRNLVIRILDAGLAEARFEQNYRAGDLRVRSLKRLRLAREDDTWRILWEGN